MKFKIATITAAAMLAVAWTASAAMVSYTVGGSGPTSYPGPVTPPAGSPHSALVDGGDGFGYPGDTVTLQAGSGMGYSFNLANGAVYNNMPIGTLVWGVDYTYNGTETSWAKADWDPLTFTVNALRSINIGTAAGNISQAGTLQTTWDDDYLSFSPGTTTSVLVQDVDLQWYRVDIRPDSLPIASVENWGGGNPPQGGYLQPSRAMTATFEVSLVAVPEPTTIIAGALLLLPFGASTVRFLRKNRTA
jgi:hypothetical protein